MFGNYLVGVFIRMASNGASVMNGVARATGGANAAVNAQVGAIGKLAPALKVAEAGFAAVGVAAAATFAIGVKGASDLQDAITQLSVSMGKTYGEVDRTFTPLALKLSNMTAQSVTDAMQTVQVMQAAVKDPAQLAGIMPSVARLSDVMYLGPHHVPFQETAKELSRVAHMFGAYDDKRMAPIADQLYRASYSTPDKLGILTTQLGYFAENYTRAGVDPAETLRMAVLGDLSLGHGKWGTGFDQILRSILKPSKEQAKAQQKLGADQYAFDEHGKFTPTRLLQHVGSITEHMPPGIAMGLIARAFPANAARTLSLASSPKALKFMDQVEKAQAKMPSLEEAQARLMNTLNNQTKRLITNFSSLATILAKPWVERFTTAVGKLADALGSLTEYFQKHPKQADAVGGVLGAWGAYGVARTASKVATHLGFNVGPLRVLSGSKLGLGGIGAAFSAIARGAALAVPWLPRVGLLLLGIGLRVVNVVGWIWTAYEILKNLPSWALFIRRWWNNEGPKIAYNIGFALGSLAKWILDGIMHLYNVIKTAAMDPKTWIGGWNKETLAALAAEEAKRDGTNKKVGDNVFGGLGAGFAGETYGSRDGSEYDHRYKGMHFHAPVHLKVVSPDPHAAGDAVFEALGGLGHSVQTAPAGPTGTPWAPAAAFR